MGHLTLPWQWPRPDRRKPSLPFVAEIPEFARCYAVGFLLERDIEIRRRAEHVKKRPEREAAAAVALQPEIDLHPFDPRCQSLAGNRGDVGGSEIAPDLIVEIHVRQ